MVVRVDRARLLFIEEQPAIVSIIFTDQAKTVFEQFDWVIEIRTISGRTWFIAIVTWERGGAFR